MAFVGNVYISTSACRLLFNAGIAGRRPSTDDLAIEISATSAETNQR
jgi:hypothetical protein